MKQGPVLVIGAGIMGAGIAQVAAQAGHDVMLHDARDGAAAAAKAGLDTTLQGLVARGKLTADAAAATLARIRALASLDEARDAALVVEAIVEKLEAKRGLLRELEGIVGDDCILATNTSSISITALANGLRHPQRLVGMHFFNPVPLMKLVEVVSGLHTDPEVAQAVFELSKQWGKTPVHARSTPGFIVNRIARPFYAETLALLAERAAEPAVLDACLRAAGFRMGPCELMDLIGHDTNFAVTNSVYEANFFDKRYVPSLVQRELVDGGLLGRKSGRGFYDHRDGAARPVLPAFEPAPPPAAQRVVLHGKSMVGERIAAALAAAGRDVQREPQSAWAGIEADALQLRLTDGRCATALGERLAVFDRLPNEPEAGAALAFAVSQRAPHDTAAQAAEWLRAAGFNPLPLQDTPGLVVARTVAMLINEASDAVQQGVCSADAADAAMKLGVNYPAGPFEWLARWNAGAVVGLLDALDEHYRGERYRASPALRLAAWKAA
jgi:3-hydroxybutyryl-CoA dehydrogenase